MYLTAPLFKEHRFQAFAAESSTAKIVPSETCDICKYVYICGGQCVMLLRSNSLHTVDMPLFCYFGQASPDEKVL